MRRKPVGFASLDGAIFDNKPQISTKAFPNHTDKSRWSCQFLLDERKNPVINLKTELSRLLPKAVDWAEKHQRDILATGIALSPEELQIARAVGVQRSEDIRIKVVDQLPLPEDPELAAAAVQLGLLGPDMSGLTLFHGIFICHRALGDRNLIAHECRHVHQYEQRHSISAFLQEYIPQLDTFGYHNAPLEKDARLAAVGYE